MKTLFHILVAALSTAIPLITSSTSHAAVITLSTTDNSTENSFGNSSGTGLSPAAPSSHWSNAGNISSSDDYVVSGGRVLRTINDGGDVTFFGNSLTIDNGTLALKGGGPATAFTVSDLQLNNGGTLSQSANGPNHNATLLGSIEVLAGGGFLANNVSTRTLTLGTSLAGAGNLTIASGATGKFVFSLTDAATFTGSLILNDGQVSFTNALVSGGGMIANTGTVISLDQNLTFTGLTIQGNVFANGTYSYATLNSTYDSIFADGGSGSITVVPEPSTWAMVVAGAMGTMFCYRRRRSYLWMSRQ